MITANNISKRFNLNRILEGVSFTINPGDRIGLIGPNGCGKSTLLKILTNQLPPDEGHITLHPVNIRIGYLSQSLELPPTSTINEVISESIQDQDYLESKLNLLAKSLSIEPDNKRLLDAYDTTLNKIEYYEPPRTHPTEILETFNLQELPDTLTISKLSGGEKTRLGLAVILVNDPDLLILDEPTNHLDIPMLEWL